jgi:glycosyltransferase involved in cell wall biosynthesis
MTTAISATAPGEPPTPTAAQEGNGEESMSRPLVSLIVPAFNEEAIIQKTLRSLTTYIDTHGGNYRWEIVVINDGSRDRTGILAEEVARVRPEVRVVHHVVNLGLGQALRTAFAASRGEYVVTLDADLSYAPDHILRLVTTLRQTGAAIVAASPYAAGGTVSSVPVLRKQLSVWANRFLAFTSASKISTVTGMVRGYDGRLLRTLDLRSTGMEINPEAIYKAMILRGRIVEIPAHLDWSQQRAAGAARVSSMRTWRHTFEVLLSGFFFKPFLLFMLPGLALLVFAAYVNAWMVIHFFTAYSRLAQYTSVLGRASAAVEAAYVAHPHTFIVGLFSITLAIQLISLGVLAKQSKHYYEELFHLGTTVYRAALPKERGNR